MVHLLEPFRGAGGPIGPASIAPQPWLLAYLPVTRKWSSCLYRVCALEQARDFVFSEPLPGQDRDASREPADEDVPYW